MLNKKDKLNKQITILQAKVDKIKFEDMSVKMKQYVGKYYKYTNCYSENKIWYEYVKISNLNLKLKQLEGLCFFEDINRQIVIMPNYTNPHYSSLRNCWIEITKLEFQKAWNKIMSELYNIDKNVIKIE